MGESSSPVTLHGILHCSRPICSQGTNQYPPNSYEADAQLAEEWRVRKCGVCFVLSFSTPCDWLLCSRTNLIFSRVSRNPDLWAQTSAVAVKCLFFSGCCVLV